MAVFLTKNAPGLRTSPVKRGYWVVKNVLGEHIPAAARRGAGAAARRGQGGSAAARAAGPAPRGPGLRRLPRPVRCAGPGVGRVRPDRREADARIWPERPVEAQRRPSRAAARARGWRACATTSARAGRTISSTTCRRKLLAYGLGRSVMLSDEQHDRADAGPAGARRLPLRQPDRERRHQPAVPDQARSRGRPAMRKGVRSMKHLSTGSVARRRRHDGAALAGVVARARRSGGGAGDRGRVPEAVGGAVHGQRHQRQPLVGQGRRRRDEARQDPAAARAGQEEDQRHQRPVQPARRRQGDPPRSDRQPAVGRAAAAGRGHQGRRDAWTRCSPSRSGRRPPRPAWCWPASSR